MSNNMCMCRWMLNYFHTDSLAFLVYKSSYFPRDKAFKLVQDFEFQKYWAGQPISFCLFFGSTNFESSIEGFKYRVCQFMYSKLQCLQVSQAEEDLGASCSA